MTNADTLKVRLAEAEEALHLLITGKSEVSITVSGATGRSVTYSAAQEMQLRRYISDLKQQLGIGRRRPIRPYF